MREDMAKAGTQKRHGDLLIVAVDGLPSRAKKAKGLTLALGEVTGHHHTLTSGQRFEVNGEQFFKAFEGTTLKHQEHGPIQFEPGYWKVVNQREFAPDRNRRVAD
jgi:hypothetical protein